MSDGLSVSACWSAAASCSATALGLKAVHAGYRVYYTTAADLVARSTRAAIEGRWQTTMRFWNGPAVLVIDELGYLPMPARPPRTCSR